LRRQAVPATVAQDSVVVRAVEALRESDLFRRVRRSEPGDDEVLRFADLSLCLRTREVYRGSRLIELTPIEFRLLELFLRDPRRVLERAFIFETVWGFDFDRMSNSLNVYVGNLRRKTEAAGEPRLLHTVRGVGYVLREPRL
jgi:two-component system response regulator MprA